LCEVETKFFGKSRSFIKYRIDKAARNNKYFNYFIGISQYLESIRELNKSNLPMDVVIKDYIISIYEYYIRFNRLPFFNQIAINVTNKIRFDEWIRRWENQNGEKYWKLPKVLSYASVVEEADEIIKQQKNPKLIESIDIDFLEI
jgi:hypothetical protein